METNEYYLKDAPMNKAIKKLSIPMIIGLSIGTVYNVINIFFIGLLKNVDMITAVTLGMPIFLILMAIGNMFGVGSSTYITRLIAKDKVDKAKSIATYAVYSSFIFSIIVSIISIIFINPLTRLLGASGTTFEFTKSYAIALFITGFMIVLNFTLEQLVRSTGATRESMYGMGISALVNLILDPLLILVFHLDLVGAAIAMSLSNLISALYYIYYLQYKDDKLKGFFKIKKISFKDKIEIFKIGFPEIIQLSFMLVSVLLLNNFSMEYGPTAEASIGIAVRISQVPEFITMGIFIGLIPLFAHSYSIKNFKRFKEAVRGSFKYILLTSISFFIIVFIFKKPIVELFSNDPEVIKLCTFIIAVMLFASLFTGLSGLLLGIFQATGKGIPTTVITLIQVLTIPALIIYHYYLGFLGVILAIPTTDLLAFLVGLIMYLFIRKDFKVLPTEIAS
ncbi:MAG: MATE family efflux transporter [Clostridium sp.]|uniref:MATE family efflux transporter n=1 Tax=Clostridium sp. TaxID=1506 RepID=UPI003F2FDB55